MKDEDRFSPTTRGADYLSYGYLGYINSEKGEDRGGTTLTRIMSSDYKLGIMT